MEKNLIECDLSTTIFEVIARVLKKDVNDLEITKGYIVDDFVCKIGTDECVLENLRLIKFSAIVEDLKCKRIPKLVLIPSGIIRPKLNQLFKTESMVSNIFIFLSISKNKEDDNVKFIKIQVL